MQVVVLLFVVFFFTRQALDALSDMEKEMEIEIGQSNWASEEIKSLALRRIKFVKKNIGYPDWYNNATIMENYFGDVSEFLSCVNMN